MLVTFCYGHIILDRKNCPTDPCRTDLTVQRIRQLFNCSTIKRIKNRVKIRAKAASIDKLFVKVWWQLPLFLLILSFTVTYIHNYICTIHSSISIHRGLPPFSSLLSLGGKTSLGVQSRDLNSGLPYSRPARYQLSFAAP
jgi:hypothetical protein